MDAMRNKNTYKNSPWIGAQTSLSPLSLYFAHSRCLYSPYILATIQFINPFSNFACINGEKTKNKNMTIYDWYSVYPSEYFLYASGSPYTFTVGERG
jgi:hypothetical protein